MNNELLLITDTDESDDNDENDENIDSPSPSSTKMRFYIFFACIAIVFIAVITICICMLFPTNSKTIQMESFTSSPSSSKQSSSKSSKASSSSSCSSCKRSKPFLKGAYLNYASTAATKNGTLNPSDIGYSQNYELRSDIESLKNEYRKMVDAPINSKVIFNSGASESIANCIFWAKCYNQYGSVVGTKYDHSAVKANCDTFGLRYTNEMSEKALMNNCALIMLTQVNSKSGEILNVDAFHRNFDKFSFMNDNLEPMHYNDYHPFNSQYTLQYRPIIALDASQSIGKVPIHMDKWRLNAVFFSLHKMGGPMGLGVLIVSDTLQFPFKPLVSGSQQMGLRGGTLPMQLFAENDWLTNVKDDANSRKSVWEQTMKQFKDSGLKVYEPKNKHLYNTFLICVKGCPMKVISKLANEGIYVGNVSACRNEEMLNATIRNNERNAKRKQTVGDDIDEGIKQLNGGYIEMSEGESDGEKDEFDNSVRITFSEANEMNDVIVKKVINACKESNGERVDSSGSDSDFNSSDIELNTDDMSEVSDSDGKGK